HRGMTDAVLADELRVAGGIALIEPHRSRRQRVAKPALPARGERDLALHVDRLRIRTQPAHRAAIDLARCHALNVEEADLLGLIVGDRCALSDGVEVEIADLLAIGSLVARHRPCAGWRRWRQRPAAHNSR